MHWQTIHDSSVMSVTITASNKCAKKIVQKPWINLTLVKYCSNKNENHPPGFGNVFGENENTDKTPHFRSLWRKPISEQVGFWKSKFGAFTSKKFQGDLTKYNPDNWRYFDFNTMNRVKQKEKLVMSQQYFQEKVVILGCDLAAAHFIVSHGGAVKFCHQDKWIKDDEDNIGYDDELPNKYQPEYLLEAIDCSKMPIIYEGLENLDNLKMLKSACFAHCVLFDNWCFDRISGKFCDSVEHIDISYTNTTYHSLSCLYRFKKLKTLKVDHLVDNLDKEFVLTYAELKKALPDLVIEGLENLMEELDSASEVSKMES